MALTKITGAQVLDGSVQRADLDSTTPGQAVVKRIIAGTNIVLTETGVDSGTGDVVVNAVISGSLNVGGAILDFTASNIATVAITGQVWVTVNSIIMASIRPFATATHSEDEHMMLASFIALSVPNALIVPGVGFSIVGAVYDDSLLGGTINIGWMGT